MSSRLNALRYSTAKEGTRYESFLIFLAPLINSVAGIAIDLYAPSLPSIGREFSVSAETMQNTITITLVFYAVGQIFFGLFADTKGRRPAILLGLSIFIVGSLLAVFSQTILMLMLARALQGFAIGACQVVARAVLVDRVKGDRFHVAIIYLSVAFGLGPVIAPFIGGHIEEAFGWRWNFGLYSVYGLAVFTTAFFGLRETLAPSARRSARDVVSGYYTMIGHPRFLSAVLLLAASFTSFLIWNVVGPYILQEHLDFRPSFFGTTALFVGLAYLGATLTNRVLVSRFDNETRLKGGLILFGLGLAVTACGGTAIDLRFLLGGTIIVACAQGFIFSNTMSISMSLFPDRAGIAASLQGCLMLIGGSIGTAIVSGLEIASSLSLATVFAVLMVVALFGYAGVRKTKP